MDYSARNSSTPHPCHGCVKMWTLRLLLLFLLTFCCGPGCCLASILDQLHYEVPEESSPQTLVGNITKDARFDTVFGASVLHSLEFSLLSVVNMEYFTITNPFGILRTSTVIDRDAICATAARCVVELKVRVQPVQYFRIIKVAVTVLDQNDNTPIFPEDSVSLSISETSLPGARFPLPLAEDADSDLYSIRSYRLESNYDVFGLRVANTTGTPTDLLLVLNRRVDRERQDFYRMKVIAMDGGTPAKTGTMWVEVSIIDANDNKPSFNSVLYEVTVPEDAPVGSVAVRVHAYDPDEGLNGDVIYSLSPPTVPGQENYYIFWTINNRTGDIYVKSPLDYEEQRVFHLSVKAQDRGANSLPAYTKVSITIEDVNDHSPEITLNSLSPEGGAQVKENMRDGTFVAHVTVTDPDQGANGEVHCSMTSSAFRLQHPNDDHGQFYILTNAVFDREFRSVYHVTLQCSDGGYPAKTSTLEIPVTIVDDNDHVPHFDRASYRVRVPENNKVNAVLLKLNATDEDSGRNADIRYKLLNPGEQSAVAVDSITGEVRARLSFDYEKQSMYSFVVYGYDQGEPSYTATSTITIEVTDTNDQPPKFLNKSYSFTLKENGPHEMELGYVEAVDNDKSPFNHITYLWDPNDPNPNPFRIDPATGLITCTRSLDHEIKSMYHLVAMATNDGYPGMSSTVPVMIKVLDVNDNVPVFHFPSVYNDTIQVPVGVTVGTVITQVKAVDPDEGSAGRLTYSLLSGNETFRINPRTGEIAMNVDIKKKEWNKLMITIQVHDAGSPPRSATVDLHIVLVHTLTSAQARSSSILSGYKLIILLVLVAFVILIVTIITIMVRLRHREGNPHKHKATTSGGITAEYTNRMDTYIDTDDDSSDGGTRPNGHLGAMSLDRPKKEVKFVMDVGTVGESSTDTSPVISWASRSEKANSLDMRSQGSEQTLLTATTITTSGETPTPTVTMTSSNPSDKAEPVWVAPWGFPRHVSLTSQPPSNHHAHSGVPPLTQMDLEMHEMLHVLGKEDSETGSVTDSGRGPSEEGDSRPNPLESSLSHEDKGAKHHTPISPMTDSASDLRNALQICASRKPGPRNSASNKAYCFHDHKAGGSCAGQCLLKPSRTLTGPFHPTSSRNMRRGFNLSSDSSDTSASSMSLPEATRTLGRFPGNHACHGNVDKKKPPTVTFQDQQNHFGSTQSLERPAGKGPMAKFAYSVPSNTSNNPNGNTMNGGHTSQHRSPVREPQPERQYPPQYPQQHPQRQLQFPTSSFYSNHDRISDSQNNNNGNSSPPSSTCSETLIVKPSSCPLETNSSPDRTSSFKGSGSRLPVKGILKKADEPIRRCINDNLSKYGPNRGWGRDRDSDVISEDGTETTLSGSYTLDVDEAIEEEMPPPPPPPDPKAGFSV